jgi:hypothetical protein
MRGADSLQHSASSFYGGRSRCYIKAELSKGLSLGVRVDPHIIDQEVASKF